MQRNNDYVYKPNLNAPYNGIEKFIFRDAYYLFMKYKSIPNKEENMKVLEQDLQILIFKYRDHPFAKQMFFNVVEQLQHENFGIPLAGLTHEQWEEKLADVKKLKPFGFS